MTQQAAPNKTPSELLNLWRTHEKLYKMQCERFKQSIQDKGPYFILNVNQNRDHARNIRIAAFTSEPVGMKITAEFVHMLRTKTVTTDLSYYLAYAHCIFSPDVLQGDIDPPNAAAVFSAYVKLVGCQELKSDNQS
jgi:hypothetical protein